MSGPKTSHYTLTLEQRRILEEQRKRRIELEMITKKLGDIRSVIMDADHIIERTRSLYAETRTDTTSLAQAEALRKAAVSALAQASSASVEHSSSQLREINQAMRTTTRKLTSIMNVLESEYSSADKAFRAELATRIDDGFNFTFDAIGEIPKVSISPFVASIQSALDDTAALVLTVDQKAKLEAIQAKFTEIEDLDFLKNFYAMTVLPFTNDCRAYHSAYAELGEEYEHKRFTYESNAKRLGIVADYIPFSSDSLAVLDSRIKETEETIRQQEEQAYISECVDEVMAEMGYSVLGHRNVTKRNGKRFRNELYLYGEGIAVNVTYSSDGKIAMELGGIDTSDRIPSSREAEQLCDSMEQFCDDFKEIEKRLLAKGVVLANRISFLPPDAEYAQIINTADYSMTTEAETFHAKKQRKSVSTQKTMRRE